MRRFWFHFWSQGVDSPETFRVWAEDFVERQSSPYREHAVALSGKLSGYVPQVQGSTGEKIARGVTRTYGVVAARETADDFQGSSNDNH